MVHIKTWRYFTTHSSPKKKARWAGQFLPGANMRCRNSFKALFLPDLDHAESPAGCTVAADVLGGKYGWHGCSPLVLVSTQSKRQKRNCSHRHPTFSGGLVRTKNSSARDS